MKRTNLDLEEIATARENTVNRLFNYAQAELFSELERESATPDQSNIETSLGKLENVIETFYHLMIPHVQIDNHIASEEYDLLKRKFVARINDYIAEEKPSLKHIFENNINFLNKIGTMAHVDYLSELSTRAVFETELEELWNKKQPEKNRNIELDNEFTVGFIDLNYLRRINDNYGHNAGDTYITSISKKMKELLRSDDVISRIGGDEIGIIFKNTDPESIKKKLVDTYDIICEHANSEIRKIAGEKYNERDNVQISIGLASSKDPKSILDLKKIVDSALYLSKAISKFHALKNKDDGRDFYGRLNNLPNRIFIEENGPTSEQKVQVYNPTFNELLEARVKGVGNNRTTYGAARNLVNKHKGL